MPSIMQEKPLESSIHPTTAPQGDNRGVRGDRTAPERRRHTTVAIVKPFWRLLHRATMRAMRRFIFPLIASAVSAVIAISAQAPAQPDWPRVEEEALRHFQALVRMNTTDPPGGEQPAA